MIIDDKEIENDIWMINITDDFKERVKNDLINLADDLNITFMDKGELKFKFSQKPKIEKLIEQFIEDTKVQSNIFELILID